MIKTIFSLVVLFIPHFKTEVVAFGFSEEHKGWIPLFPVEFVEEGEEYRYGILTSIAFMGQGFFPKMKGELFDLTWSEIEKYKH